MTQDEFGAVVQRVRFVGGVLFREYEVEIRALYIVLGLALAAMYATQQRWLLVAAISVVAVYYATGLVDDVAR